MDYERSRAHLEVNLALYASQMGCSRLGDDDDSQINVQPLKMTGARCNGQLQLSLFPIQVL